MSAPRNLSGWCCEIEEDGPRYRWVLWWKERRMAKGARWWNSEEEAMADYDYFCGHLREEDK